MSNKSRKSARTETQTEDETTPIATLLNKPARATEPPHTLSPVHIGVIAGIRNGTIPLVRCAAFTDGKPVPAIFTCAPIDASHVGHRVMLQFLDDDLAQPAIMGIATENLRSASPAPMSTEFIQDENQIIMRTPKASITVTTAGKIIFDGEYILSHSSGANHVIGASVDIN
jgi:hypothetical protein